MAIVDGEVVGHVAIIQGVAWSRHVGELRLVIDPEHRRRGLGRLLAQRAVVEAVELGMTKLVVEVVAEQEATVAMFTGLGFEAEGLLRDQVRSQSGQVHDLLVLSHFVEELWATMATTGVDELVAGRRRPAGLMARPTRRGWPRPPPRWPGPRCAPSARTACRGRWWRWPRGVRRWPAPSPRPRPATRAPRR